MATPEPPDDDDDFINDYTSNASFDQGDGDDADVDVSTSSSVSAGSGEGHNEYASYSHMVDVAVKSNGQMLALYTNIIEGQAVFAFSEGYVWVGDTKHGVQVMNVKNFDCVKKLGGQIAMRCMTIVDNEVWVGYCNGDIHVYDKNNYDKPPKEITSSSSKTSIDCIAHSDGIIWTGSADWELRARRQSSGATIRSLPDGHRDWIRSILIVGSNLWSSGDDSFIYLWDAETGEKVRTIELKTKSNIKVKCAVLCIVGRTVWGGCADGFIRIWNYEGDYIKRFKAHRGAVTSLVCCGAHVWSGGLDKKVKIWEREALRLVETISVTFSISAMGMHGTQVYLGGRGVIQVRMTSGLLEWLRDTYRRLDEDYTKLLQVYESLLVKYEDAEPEKMREIINQLQREREAMEGEMGDMQDQIEKARGDLEALEEQRDGLTQKLKTVEEASKAKIKELETDRDDLRSQIGKHKTKHSESETKINEHMTKAQEYETLVAKYEAKAADYESRLAEFETKLAESKKNEQETQTKLAEYKASAESLEEQLKQEVSEKEELTQQLADLQAKIEESQEALDKATKHGQKTSEDSSKQGAQLRETIEKLEKENQALQAQEQMLKSVIAAKESKISGDKEAQVALEDQVLRLESDVRSRDDAMRVMNAKYDKQLKDVSATLSQAAATARVKPTNFAEQCAIFVIFVLCTCLIFAMLMFLFVNHSDGRLLHYGLPPH